MRGGVTERGHQLLRESSVGEDKVMRAVVPRLRSRLVAASGNPRRPSRQRRKVTEGAENTKRSATGVMREEARYPTR